jgi:hypothetical protein
METDMLRPIDKRRQSSLVVLVVVVFLEMSFSPVQLAESYSWGAGSCDAGGAVGGYHLESYEGDQNIDTPVPKDHIRCIRSGTLHHSGIDVVIGNQLISSDTTPIEPLQYNIDYEIQVYMLKSIFRGILIRLSPSNESNIDLTGSLYTTDPLLQVATTACATPTVAVGVTHRSAIDKDLVFATLRFDNETIPSNTTTKFNLEITVVGSNNEYGSVYAYSLYEIQVSPLESANRSNSSEESDKGIDFDDNFIPQLTGSSDDVQNAASSNSTSKDKQVTHAQSSLVIGLTVTGGSCLAVLSMLSLGAKMRHARNRDIPL